MMRPAQFLERSSAGVRPMEVSVDMMIQDPLVTDLEALTRPTEGFVIKREPFFLDGPVTRRVAVLDLDPDTGQLEPGARFAPPKPPRKRGTYLVPKPDDLYSPAFIQTSVFATVLRTVYMFEGEETLGREVRWAFDGPQLLVVPRAGKWANAFYERESRSLQLFFFDTAGRRVYTSLSRDVVAHETGHAVLDGIAPALYHAVTPQSLALHEAVADMTALFLSLQSQNLVGAVLRETQGSIQRSTAFNSIAEEFGRALDREGQKHYLRNLNNDKTLDPNDESLDELGRPNRVERDEPHDLSEVLSGALYRVLMRLHDATTRRFVDQGMEHLPASGKALGIAGRRLRRMYLRALDYLPPGEISFADYGRAVLAADQASHPEDGQERAWIREELVRRHMVDDAAELAVETNVDVAGLDAVDLATLVASDWAAYDFANRHRDLLGIPDNVPFTVLPRLDSTKRYYPRGGGRLVRECILKVAWDHSEPNRLGPAFPAARKVTVGTTLAIDWATGRVRSRLTTDPRQQRQDRDRLLLRMADTGVLVPDRMALGPDGRPLRSFIRAEALGDVMRVRGAARMLHLTPLVS
jgi:hypothetical protein